MKNLPTYDEFVNEQLLKGSDIIITLPSKTKWEDYKNELLKVENGEAELNFKVSNFPVNCKEGNRCYLVHKNKIVGWMKIIGFEEKEFVCEVTGKKWIGKFIKRSGKFTELKPHIPMKGFRGFKYVKHGMGLNT